jgi:O-antigen ligase
MLLRQAAPLGADRPAPRLAVVAGWAIVVIAAAEAGAALASHPPPVLTVGAAVAALAALALALARYDLVVGLGFLLLGVARVEPSPSDALLAVAIAVAVAGGGFDLRRVPGAILALLGVLLALSVLSTMNALDLGEALRFLLITTYLMTFAVWLATYLRTEGRMRRVIGAYVIGAAAFSVAAVLALLVSFPDHADLVRDGARAEGLFKDPNVFGPFLVPAALILLCEVLHPRLLRLRRSTTALMLFAVSLGVVLSYSRAAWLNLAVALAVMVVATALRPGSGRTATATVALLTASIALAGTVIVASGSTGFLRERARPQAYDAERFQAQRAGVVLAERHPLGIGPGQVEIEGPVATHSIYVRVLAEQGVAGLATLVALLGGTLLLAAANALAGRFALGLDPAALLGAWCGLLANSAFVDTLHWRHLWFVAALIWVGSLGRRHGQLRSPRT